MKSTIRMLLKGIEILALIFVFLVAATYIYGIKPTIILSGSMEPKLMTGCIAFVNQRVEYEDIAIGDIIEYKTETGVSCIHRAIKITEEGIETKGDNNDHSDGITTIAENFKGKVVFSVPKLGYSIMKLKTPKGIICIVAFIAGLALLSYAVADTVNTSDEQNDSKIKGSTKKINKGKEKPRDPLKEYDTL